MTIGILVAMYFVFFLITNIMLFQVCVKILEKPRFGTKILYVVALVNAGLFTFMVYGFNQLPTVTYLMILIGGIVQLTILFKNHLPGILMCSFMATIYLVCVESIVISSSALILGVTIGDITHSHQLLCNTIVASWFVCMVISICLNKLIPSRYIKIIVQNMEQTLFVLGFLFAATVYLTYNSFIYANADNFDPIYLPVHQVVTPISWLVVVTLAVVLLIRFDHLHGYKVKSDLLQKVVEEKETELSLTKSMAERDSLVKAYNKATTELKIKEALEDKEDGAFFIIDIDDFKNINDSKGHPFGDKVLVYLYKRIVNTVRDDDIVGRVGGDEFIVFIKNVPSLKVVENKAKSLCRGINVPFADNDGYKVTVSISVGVALVPQHGNDFESLYRKADIALYQSKDKGKNTYTIFDV